MNLNDASRLARQLMNIHGLANWEFRFDRAVQRFGCCYACRKLITMSAPLTTLNPESEVVDMILHEIAHALVGEGHGHDTAWKAQARAIGCRGQRCYPHWVKTPRPKYRGTCPNCGRWWERNRRIRAACGACSPTHYHSKYRLTWTKVSLRRS
jgi:predicted SprT family Zn-dependent metalloprotease